MKEVLFLVWKWTGPENPIATVVRPCWKSMEARLISPMKYDRLAGPFWLKVHLCEMNGRSSRCMMRHSAGLGGLVLFYPFTSVHTARGIDDLFVNNFPLKHLLNLSINFWASQMSWKNRRRIPFVCACRVRSTEIYHNYTDPIFTGRRPTPSQANKINHKSRDFIVITS